MLPRHIARGRRRAPMLMSVAFIALLFGGYLIFQASDVIFGPELHVEAPRDGEVITGSVSVQGITDPQTSVSINGFSAQSDEEGNFKGILPLSPGPHVLHIVVENRFGKEARDKRQIMVR